MKALQYKEWKLAMSPVPFFFSGAERTAAHSELSVLCDFFL